LRPSAIAKIASERFGRRFCKDFSFRWTSSRRGAGKWRAKPRSAAGLSYWLPRLACADAVETRHVTRRILIDAQEKTVRRNDERFWFSERVGDQ
jgi:hypothetical protein